MLTRVGAGMTATTPVEFMLGVMTNDELPLAVRLYAAVRVAPYMHPRLQAVMHAQQPSGKSDLQELLEELDGMSRGIPACND